MKFRIAAAALAVAASAITLFAAGSGAPAAPRKEILAGYDAGLYRLEADGSAVPLWLDGEVRKILRTSGGWYLLTSRGVIFSKDLAVFEDRSGGLPAKTYKRYDGSKTSFLTESQDLKDLEADPADPLALATCTKDAVFVTRDGGASWKSFGTPVDTTGLKATALAPFPVTGEPAVYASHPIKGLFARKLSGGGWVGANSGLATIVGTTSVEEIADLVPAVSSAASGAAGAASGASWASNSFIPRIYRLDAKAKSFATAWTGQGDFGCVESLESLPDGSLRFVTDGYVGRLDPAIGRASPDDAANPIVAEAARAKPELQALCVSWDEDGRQASLSELWLVAFKDRKPYRARAENRQGLYLVTGFIVREDSRAKYDKVMESRRLDTIVVDMKDDFGRLRFEPRDSLVSKIGKVSSPLDVEAFVREWKAKGRYLVARIPVFKDEVVHKYGGGKYAVWDSGAGAPWRGYNTVAVPATAPSAAPVTAPAAAPGAAATPQAAAPQAAAGATTRELIGEYWVDPYCEEAWAYNIAIANEIVQRGFDEVQFDYIRFPTDGENIGSASYRWKSPGMDKESALASFMRYARENIEAPISIDIYGANGWYRSGVRTGQDVELLAKYVDVICPMFYPSHFEQGFLAQAPAELRPYRIYRLGSLRNAYIARKKVVVRPFVQAFYLNVSYDRAYYNLDYVKREVAGVRDSVNLGMTFWNNSGRYDDVPVLELAPDGKLAQAESSPQAKR
jgi:hypothetical protein